MPCHRQSFSLSFGSHRAKMSRNDLDTVVERTRGVSITLYGCRQCCRIMFDCKDSRTGDVRSSSEAGGAETHTETIRSVSGSELTAIIPLFTWQKSRTPLQKHAGRIVSGNIIRCWKRQLPRQKIKACRCIGRRSAHWRGRSGLTQNVLASSGRSPPPAFVVLILAHNQSA